jgi:hypothetical protein
MAGTVAGLNMTTVSLCNAIGDWSGSPSPALNDPDLFGQKEGANCLQSYQAASGARSADWTWTGDQDLTDKVIYMWFAISRITGIPVKGSTGMRIRIEDASANWAEWDIFGSDTLPHGGWICWAVEANSATANRTGGTFPTLTTIRKVGWRCGTTLGKVYIYWDAVRYGQGLQIYAGTSGSPAVLDDFVTSENTNAWGVVNKYKGIYFIQGKLNFGSTSSAQATYFKDTGKTLVFQDNLITSTFYELKTLTNADADTEIYFGESSGISGCLFGVESPTQTARYVIDFSSAQRTKIGIYGCIMKRSGTVSLPPYNASYSREALNTSFEGCGQILPDSCPVTNCNFISTADTDAALLWNENIDIDNCYFIGNTTGAGIEMPSAAGSPYAYDALLFSGNTNDVLNSSGSAISINKNNGSDPTTYEGSSVTFLGVSVDTKIICKDVTDLSLIENARVLLEAADATGPLNFEESVTITRVDATATVTHTGHGLATNDWVHIKGANEPEYNTVDQITVTGADAYTYTVSGTPATPATGTITSTTAIFNTLTNSSGYVLDTRTFASNQNVTGRARKSTTSPLYQSQPITGTINKDNGLTLNVLLIPDE